jgi:hypothetical protein
MPLRRNPKKPERLSIRWWPELGRLLGPKGRPKKTDLLAFSVRGSQQHRQYSRLSPADLAAVERAAEINARTKTRGTAYHAARDALYTARLVKAGRKKRGSKKKHLQARQHGGIGWADHQKPSSKSTGW